MEKVPIQRETVETNSTIPYHVYREDDNGVRTLVDTFPDKHTAQLQIDILEAGHHKQFYWTQTTADDTQPNIFG